MTIPHDRNEAEPAAGSHRHRPASVSLAGGIKILKAALKTMPGAPGVYRMLNHREDILYVGKAKNLRKRVTNYTNAAGLSNRLRRMVAGTVRIEVITTESEVEALLLESNLIKKLKPIYNIVLRDDKSYPYILITDDHAWPQIVKYRGARKKSGEYFGPFASAGAVNQTINALHRAFPLRSCSDGIFSGRTRPCLQYQIKRCAAPCVGRISNTDYLALVKEAQDFLSGRSQQIQKRLTERMTEASERLEFETAAAYRDRIRALAHIQSRQGVNVHNLGDVDVIAVHQQANQSCVQVFFYRGGQNFGNRPYFPRHPSDATASEVLGAFLGQFYNDKDVPPAIVINERVPEEALLVKALQARATRKVQLLLPARGAKRRLADDATRNAREALSRRLAESASQRKLLDGLQDHLALDAPPARIEVYDNSHISGTHAVGGMIVVGPEGFEKNAYRKFNIRTDKLPEAEGGITAGDDYGMMREVLTRRFGRLVREDPERAKSGWPDLCLIDGGVGQLTEAEAVFADLGITEVALAAIAKGPDRNAGREVIHMPDKAPTILAARDPVLYFLQRIRDEAHRFAIGSHRTRRKNAATRSPLDDIAGIGPKRKRALLHHFGSARAISQAGVRDLEQVEGISKALAQTLFDNFHNNN